MIGGGGVMKSGHKAFSDNISAVVADVRAIASQLRAEEPDEGRVRRILAGREDKTVPAVVTAVLLQLTHLAGLT